jgi:hypothetical protein
MFVVSTLVEPETASLRRPGCENVYDALAVLPEEVVNLGEGWAVADGAVVASRVVVLQPVSQWSGRASTDTEWL